MKLIFRKLALGALRFIKYSTNVTVLAFASGRIYHIGQIFYSEPKEPEERNSMAEGGGDLRLKSHGEPTEKEGKNKSISTVSFIYNIRFEKLHTVCVRRQISQLLTFPSSLPSLLPELRFFIFVEDSRFGHLF